jgi:hypothetical protein
MTDEIEMIPVTITVEMQGYFCNHWPYVKIMVNNQVMADVVVENLKTVEFTVNCDQINTLCVQHHSKNFGENGIFDTDVDSKQDCKLQIVDIKFDEVSIDLKLRSELSFTTHWSQLQIDNNSTDFIREYSWIEKTDGWLTFNGETKLEFETPIYDWLIIKKYKVPRDNRAVFSNHSARWHYEENIAIIEEIKKLMELDENRNISHSQT